MPVLETLHGYVVTLPTDIDPTDVKRRFAADERIRDWCARNGRTGGESRVMIYAVGAKCSVVGHFENEDDAVMFDLTFLHQL